MDLNTDFSKRVVLRSDTLAWQDSPMPGVQRRQLARSGGEDAQATSVVRYEPGATFPAHVHPRGEEIVVLDGEFADEHGVYPAGTYIKNPPGSSHAPRSDTGCTLFVKLRHLDEYDLERVVLRPSARRWQQGMVPGLQVLGLDQFGASHTALVRWAPGTVFSKHFHYGGEEIFVLEGTFQDEFGDYPRGTWIRSPHLSAHQPFSEAGCTILVKVGHLL
ncbi:MAG TPA: cupin [Janthinobacterium sp.]|nr:cupin [Janthinobacterium sp.]